MQKCFLGQFTFDWVLHRRMHSGDRLLQMMESARKSKHWSALGLINHNHIFESSCISIKYNRVLRDSALFDVVLYNSDSFVDSYS